MLPESIRNKSLCAELLGEMLFDFILHLCLISFRSWGWCGDNFSDPGGCTLSSYRTDWTLGLSQRGWALLRDMTPTSCYAMEDVVSVGLTGLLSLEPPLGVGGSVCVGGVGSLHHRGPGSGRQNLLVI